MAAVVQSKACTSHLQSEAFFGPVFQSLPCCISRQQISHVNANKGVDMPMIGTSERAGQVRTGYQSLFSSGTVLTTAGSERGGR